MSLLSPRKFFHRLHTDDEMFRLFCSIAAAGESQGGWENARIAELVADPELAPKIARHGADEDKHGRLFTAMLRRRGLEPVEVPPETNYTMLLERQGIGLAHERLRQGQPLTEHDVLVYLAHSRVTEQRGVEDIRMLRRHLGDDPDIGRSIRMICQDEENHLAYTQEELLRLARAGHGAAIRRILRETAEAEIRIYRDVSIAVIDRLSRLAGCPPLQRALLRAGIRLRWLYELAFGKRRLVRLRAPERLGALGPFPADRPDSAPQTTA